MRGRSKQQYSLDEGDKDTVWKVTPSHWPCRWPSLLAAPLPWHICVRAFWGLVSPDSFSQGSWWPTPGTTTSRASHAIITAPTSHLFPPLLSPLFFPHLLYRQDITVRYATAIPPPSQISFHWWDPAGLRVPNFRRVQCPYPCLPHTRAGKCVTQKCT